MHRRDNHHEKLVFPHVPNVPYMRLKESKTKFEEVQSVKKVLFLHGWSSDGGTKTAFLRSLGYDVSTPRLSDWFFSRAVAQAQAAYDQIRPDVIVGSRGGAVAMSMDSG